MNKRIAILLYAVYALLLVLIITFGKAAAYKIHAVLTAKLNDGRIEDVTTDLSPSEPLAVRKTHYVKYTVHGDYFGDAGLVFESLTQGLSVTPEGALYAENSFEGDTLDAVLRITSKHDKKFEKEISLRFSKIYPKNFTASYYVRCVGEESPVAYVGIPLHPFAKIPEDEVFTETSYDILYDESFFTYDERYKLLIPIRASADGEMFSFTVVYPNGARAESAPFRVESAPESVDEIDGIELLDKSGDGTLTVKENAFLALYRKGERIVTDYELRADAAEGGYISRSGMVGWSSAGEKHLTVTLPSGFAKTFTVKVKNVLALPKISDQNEHGELAMKHTDVKTVQLRFPEGVTYTNVSFLYDKTLLSITRKDRTVTLTPKGIGKCTVTMVIDDGDEQLSEAFTVSVRRDYNVLALIAKSGFRFVAKFMGHLSLFAVLALFSLNLFRFVTERRRIWRFCLYSLTALPLALLTELIQLCIPNRTFALCDVGIDMLGFYLGTLFIVSLVALVRLLVRRIRKIRKIPH